MTNIYRNPERAASNMGNICISFTRTPFTKPKTRLFVIPMMSITIIGAQWGDEGKGKIVDWLSAHADIVVRFQGGHNAGHTLVINGVVYKLSLLPSGIVRPGKLSIIGNGVVVNPWALLEEIERLRGQGVAISQDNLLLADNACLILPPHWAVDQARELAKGAGKIGTTGRGIGPAYEDKVARRAIRVCDLLDPALLQTKIEQLLMHHNALLRGYGAEELDAQTLHKDLLAITPQLLPYVGQSWRTLNQATHKRLLFEGAQGVMLDIDHGTYPFVTSSNTIAANASIGSGFGKSAQHVLGVAKAYVTRVGSGPFPTRAPEQAAHLMGQRGKEFGTVTGRKRDCGWFDAVLMRQAIQIAGINSLVLTKIDVLDEFDLIPVCTGYELDGQRIDYLPAGQSEQALVTPIYENLPGWKCSTHGVRSWNALPNHAQAYIDRLEQLIGIPICVVSTSPERADTILRVDRVFKNSVDMSEISTGIEQFGEFFARQSLPDSIIRA